MTTEEEKLVTDNIKMAYDIKWKLYKRVNNSIELDHHKR